MSSIRTSFMRLSPVAALFALLTLGAGPALAAPSNYNIILKQAGAPKTCARGGFVFDKAALAGASSGSASSAQLVIDAGCFTRLVGRNQVPWPSEQLTFTGNLTIHLKNQVVKQEQPVASVFGISGEMSSGNNSVVFEYNPNTGITERVATVCDNPACNSNSTVAVLTYHAFNEANAVPEPETLALLLLGALGLGFARWRRRA